MSIILAEQMNITSSFPLFAFICAIVSGVAAAKKRVGLAVYFGLLSML